ncbi:LOW QUALITY PROTEIN: structural maintenance of chromosomes flexible hinge domain-containing protein 1 [Aplochiton taeniatus]
MSQLVPGVDQERLASSEGCVKVASLDDKPNSKTVVVYDCRFENNEHLQITLDIKGLDFVDFLQVISKVFAIPSSERFVLTTTDRTGIDLDNYEELQHGNTLHLFQKEDQILPVATHERIKFLPHYDTLVQSGMYEYYASEGQKSLPYAFAELIDNTLSATSRNTGVRTIDIRLLFDESLGKPAVVVLDNGCGMTSKQLNNWAVYRLSKFTRESNNFARCYTIISNILLIDILALYARSHHYLLISPPSSDAEYVRPDPVPRSLNSDISYFGVGGKQAVFYIGQSTRMITRSLGSPDVHELILSKEEFERKERNKEEIYSGYIRNRKVGDFSHVTNEEESFLRAIISEETEKESFTAVVVTGVLPEHIAYLKQDFHIWTRELAHIYHYYIHGLNGNDMKASYRNSDCVSNIDIQITLLEKFPKIPRLVNLREIDNDMQTLYINSAADTFEFKAYTDSDGAVEGILRYHPFLYDRETYPEDPYAVQDLTNDNEDDDVVFIQARGKRPIFECFWNGRLIPYTTVSEFDWCSRPKKATLVPSDSYNRFSGVLFTNDRFQVSTNKLTFMDLELQLRNKDTIFTRLLNGQEQRVKIQKEFNQWLKYCHEKWDKQVKFSGFKGTVTRTDVTTKKMQYPWASFSSIEWDGKTYKTGQYVKSQKTVPLFFGSVVRFLLYGDHDGDLYATGGNVEVAMEPKALYDEVKTIPISKIDRTVTNAAIKKCIEDELAKLPEKLKVAWPQCNPWPQNTSQPAGTPLGPFQVEILNKKGESISRMPSGSHAAAKKLLIELKVIWHGPNGEQETNSHIAQHSAKWGFWFKQMENLSMLGRYTMCLNTVLNESNATVFAGKQLPCHQLHFTIKEGSAERFVVGAVSNQIQVGVPFDIPLELLDEYGHPALPSPDLKPVLKCCYNEVVAIGMLLNIKGVEAKGTVPNYLGKLHEVIVILPGLRHGMQTLKISVWPVSGNPHSLKIKPEDDPITVENGNSVNFNVEVHDEAGNITAQPKQIVRFQLQGPSSSSSTVAIDCSNSGTGLLVTKSIKLKNLKAEHMVKAKFDMPSLKKVAVVLRDLKVVPSTQPCCLELYSQDDEDTTVLKDKEKIEWEAGDMLDNLCYRLYDEGGREVPLTAEQLSGIKVNWTADMNLEDLAMGKLPRVHVPTLVQDEHFYQVSYQDHNISVDTSFTIVPRPSDPKHLKATLGDDTVRMGEPLGKIYLELADQFGNITQALTSSCVYSITVDGEGLDKSSPVFKWQEKTHSIMVTGVQFQPGLPGTRELCFTWKDLVEHVRVKMTAGVPARLQLVDGPQETLQVLNEHGIPTAFLIQLCDEWGNPSPDQRVVVALKVSTPALKVRSSVMSQPLDVKGNASFLVESVIGPKGEYELEFEGSFNRRPITGPSVKLIVLPNPNKPVKLAVEYDNSAIFQAGKTLPVFSVLVVSEEGSLIKNLNPAYLSMLMWKGEESMKAPPPGATHLMCSKPKENEKDDRFHFRDKDIPDRVGKYTIQFALCVDKTKGLWSHQHVINVVANDPMKLAPDSQPPTPVVSNTDSIASRTMVEGMTLRIMDKFGNPTGFELKGKVVISITNSNGNSDNKTLPMFQGKAKTIQIPITKGQAHVTNVVIMENSPGQHGNEYVLHFKPFIPGFGPKKTLAAFDLPFRFINDIQHKQETFELTQKKDQLSSAIEKYKSVFDTNKQLFDEFSRQVRAATGKLNNLKLELTKNNIDANQLTTIPETDAVITEKSVEARRIELQPRRVCSILDPFKGSKDVLGKIGNLALITDDDAATVLSWHMMGDMDCVVTTTTAAARKIYDDTHGKQQVMPLDSVFWRENQRPLPHIRNGQSSFVPTGNPVFIRELLIFSENRASCEMAFGNLVGDTILIDDLDSANHYRRGVVQMKCPCPTILTRRGERISTKGKFGGAHNKAPAIEKLRGQVFGAPLPAQYHTLKRQIDLLQKCRGAIQTSQVVKGEFDKHMHYLKSAEMVLKEEEMEQKQRQLKEIEAKLASTRKSSSAGIKRSFKEAGESSSSKKIRPK